MKPLDDQELTTLLRKWEAPLAPSSLRLSVSPVRVSLLQWLWRGSIRVPAPVGVAIVVIAVIAGFQFTRSTVAPLREVPKSVAPFTGPAPVQNSNDTPSAEAENSRPTKSAPELAGFRPVHTIEPRSVGTMR